MFFFVVVVLFCLIDSTGTCGTGVRILFKRMEGWRKKKCVRLLGTLIIRMSQIKGESGNMTQEKCCGEDTDM